MNYLFVVAHPDDESDAAGGTIHKLIKEGHNVAVAIIKTFFLRFFILIVSLCYSKLYYFVCAIAYYNIINRWLFAVFLRIL